MRNPGKAAHRGILLQEYTMSATSLKFIAAANWTDITSFVCLLFDVPLHFFPEVTFGLLHPAILKIAAPVRMSHSSDDPAAATVFTKQYP